MSSSSSEASSSSTSSSYSSSAGSMSSSVSFEDIRKKAELVDIEKIASTESSTSSTTTTTSSSEEEEEEKEEMKEKKEEKKEEVVKEKKEEKKEELVKKKKEVVKEEPVKTQPKKEEKKEEKPKKEEKKEEIVKDEPKKEEPKVEEKKPKKAKKEVIFTKQAKESSHSASHSSSSSSEEKIDMRKKLPVKVIGEASHPSKPLSPFIIPSPFEDVPEDVIDPLTDLKSIKGIHKQDKQRLEAFTSSYKDGMKSINNLVTKMEKFEGVIFHQERMKEPEITYKRFGEEVRKLAKSYAALRYPKRGVLIISKNHWKSFAMGVACVIAGMHVVYANPKAPITDIAEMIKHAGVVQIVTDIDGKDIVRDLLTVSKLRCVLVDGVVHDDLYMSYDDFVKKGNKKKAENQQKIVDALKKVEDTRQPTDIAEIVFTQGEKGIRGVMWTHGNIISQCLGLLERFKLTQKGRYVMSSHQSFYLERIFTLYLPMFVGYKVYIPVYPLHHEGLKEYFAVCKEFKPTYVLGIPRFYEKIVRKGDEFIGNEKKQKKTKKMGIQGLTKQEKGSSKPKGYGATRTFVYNKIKDDLGLMDVEYFWCSDPLQKETMEDIMGKGIVVYSGLSMVETTGFCTINYEDNINSETAGKPMPQVTIATNDQSHLIVNGPTVAGGYVDMKFGSKGFNTQHKVDYESSGDSKGFVKMIQLNPEFIYTTNHEIISIKRMETLLKKISIIKNVLVVGTHQTFIVCIFTVSYDVAKEKLKEKCPSRETFLKDSHFGSYVRQRIDRLNKLIPIPLQVKKFAFIEEGTEHSTFIKESMNVNERVASIQHFEKLIEALYTRGNKPTQMTIDYKKEKEIQKQRQKEEKQRLKEEKQLRREKKAGK